MKVLILIILTAGLLVAQQQPQLTVAKIADICVAEQAAERSRAIVAAIEIQQLRELRAQLEQRIKELEQQNAELAAKLKK